jgi:Zn-dependent membrane protease YugP
MEVIYSEPKLAQTMSIAILIGIGAMILSQIVRWRFQSTLKRLAEIPTSSGLSGAEIAGRMLKDFGVSDVQVTATGGMLTDHYNPANKTVNLSEGVFAQRSVAAAAVAAHECGHAVQHQVGYSMLRFRSAIVPVVSISNRFTPFVLIGGILMIETFPQLLLAGIILLAATTLFTFVTLPVEFDASRRALAWLEESGISEGVEYEEAKKGLKWAAMTYVVAALTSLATLLYYLSIFMRRN